MTSTVGNRSFAWPLAIVMAACIGAHCFLAAMPGASAASVRSRIAQIEHEQAASADVGSLSDSQVEILRRTTAERADRIRDRSSPALDEATMFARVSDLAAANSLRLEHLNPTQILQPSTPSAPASPGASSGTPTTHAEAAKDARVGYSIAVTGAYSDLVAFIGAITNRLGFTVIKTVSISQPDLKKPDTLRALIETEHIAVDLSAIKTGPVAPTRQPMPITDDPVVPPSPPSGPRNALEE